ncbi:MAG: C45 family autoproteolytic acyltransferase/hydrolase [Actinomycetota bacterium]
MNVVHASGSPRALGRAQGEAFADGIHSACDFYRALAASLDGDFDAMGARGRAYLDAARPLLPELVQELQGVVEGAGISLDEGLALNCLEEVWDVDSCTTIVHDRFFIHAEQWYAGHTGIGVVVAEPEDGPAFVSPTCAGFLPSVGMSAAGFAQGIDSVSATDERVGIPRVFVSRLALGAPGLAAAVAAACTKGRAGGYAHVLASIDRRVVVETSATRHEVSDGGSAHTNHYLLGSLGAVATEPHEGSRARLRRANDLLRRRPPASLEDCTQLLSDHAGGPETICLHEEGPGASATVFGMACDLLTGRMIVSDGPPCSSAWEELAVPASRAAARHVG